MTGAERQTSACRPAQLDCAMPRMLCRLGEAQEGIHDWNATTASPPTHPPTTPAQHPRVVPRIHSHAHPQQGGRHTPDLSPTAHSPGSSKTAA